MTESLGKVKTLLGAVDQDSYPAPDETDGQEVDLSGYQGADIPETVGSGEPLDFPTAPADLTEEAPAGVALLCVMRGKGPGEFTMAWNDGRASHQTINKAPSAGGQSIADIMQGARQATDNGSAADTDSLLGGPWQKAYGKLKMHWSGLPDLGSWVKQFSASTTVTPHLVIWDVTGQDIPWELYHGGMGSETNGVTQRGWLGTTLPVSRWVGGSMPRHQDLGTGSRSAAGPVLLFDDGQTHDQYEDAQHLDAYRSIAGERVGEPETSMKALLDRLERDDFDFGLLVIRGHGHYAEDLETFTLAGLPLLRLADTRLTSLVRNRPAILLNVCHSGRTWVDESAPNFPVRGFVEPLIERGASTVIAIMAQIDTTHLHETALQLIKSARQSPVAVAEWLRDHRARYLRALNGVGGVEKEELYRMFLTSSLYVCYCQPGTTLYVTKASPAPVPDELPTRGEPR